MTGGVRKKKKESQTEVFDCALEIERKAAEGTDEEGPQHERSSGAGGGGE